MQAQWEEWAESPLKTFLKYFCSLSGIQLSQHCYARIYYVGYRVCSSLPFFVYFFFGSVFSYFCFYFFTIWDFWRPYEKPILTFILFHCLVLGHTNKEEIEHAIWYMSSCPLLNLDDMGSGGMAADVHGTVIVAPYPERFTVPVDVMGPCAYAYDHSAPFPGQRRPTMRSAECKFQFTWNCWL